MRTVRGQSPLVNPFGFFELPLAFEGGSQVVQVVGVVRLVGHRALEFVFGSRKVSGLEMPHSGLIVQISLKGIAARPQDEGDQRGEKVCAERHATSGHGVSCFGENRPNGR